MTVAVVLALASPTFAGDAVVTAEVSPNPVGTEDTLTVNLTVSGTDLDRVSEPVLPAIPGAKVLSGPSQSKQTSLTIVNGRFSQSTTIDFTWELLPKAEGTLTIPPIEVKVGGKVARSDPVAVEVVKGETRPRSRPGGRGQDPFDRFLDHDSFFQANPHAGQEVSARDVIVEAVVDRPHVTVGQAVVLTTRLLIGGSVAQVSNLRLVDGGDLKDFWVETVEVDPEKTREVVEREGRQYRAFTIDRKILFPTAPGRFTYGPATYEIAVQGTGFGFFGSSRSMHPRAGPLVIEAEALPEKGRPADFSGAVGRFTIRSQTDKASVAQGEAISYEVTIEGRGNLKTASDPKLAEEAGFKVFSAKSRDESRVTAGGVEGKRVLSYVLIPERAGETEIPRLTFSFFDPEEGRYGTVSPDPVRVAVKPGEAPAVSAGAGAGAASRPVAEAKVMRKGEDIRYIKSLPGDPVDEGRVLYRSPLFVPLVAAPPLANAVLLLAGWRRRMRRSDQTAWTARRAGRVALASLKGARRKLEQGDGEGFHAELSDALVRYLAEKHGVPVISAAPGRLSRAMEGKGVDEAVVLAVEQVIEGCDTARFALGATSREAMEKLYEQALAAVRALEGKR